MDGKTGSQKIDRYLRLTGREGTAWWDAERHEEALRDVLALPRSVLRRHESLVDYLDGTEEADGRRYDLQEP